MSSPLSITGKFFFTFFINPYILYTNEAIIMALGEKIKLLRKESGWSQDELARKINADGRQISRYENGKFLPSADAIVKLAEVFNVSIDYLLLDDAARKPLHFNDEALMKKLQELDTMTEEDRNSLIHIIDAIAAKNRIKTLAENVR
jgi:transcriptional regulator with XRE-family HTH domain